MKRTFLRCVLAVSLLGYSASWGIEPDCFKSLRGLVNKNGFIPVEEYKQANSRPLHTYVEHLGKQFENILNRSNVGWLDVGGGFGAAALKKSLQNGKARVTVVNAQDNWKPFLGRNPAANPHLNDISDKLLKIAAPLDVPMDDIVVVRDDRPIYRPDWKVKLIHSLADLYRKALARGNFDYRVGFAEEVLPKLASHYDAISDLFGAYYYSGGRPDLLDDYYRLLNDQGEAFVVFRSKDKRWNGEKYVESEHGPENVVVHPDGTKESLEEFLVRKYPGIFSIVDTGHWQMATKVLTIKKDPHIAELHLDKLLSQTKTWFGDEGTHMNHVPSAEWTLK